ncbi:MAG: hypothetical protein EPN48_16900 [Microbacteriaceae bacterium]|nr:MAG: hypothetical protein EPN48_16900 [Microbacteriaceae bacterium]
MTSAAVRVTGVIEASAPGKLFLLGEYAVLHGAPALLTAVDRRARVTVVVPDAADAANDAGWRFTAPAIGIAECSLQSDGALPPTLDDDTRARLRVFDAVRRVVAKSVASAPPGLTVTVDSAAFWHRDHKLGLGSSAAVAAALTAALAAAHGLSLTQEELVRRATDAHRRAQGGTGSGGDVAASCSGGLITFTREWGAAAGPRLMPQHWPDDLELRVVATGAGSSSTELVGRVAEYGRRDPRGHAADLDRLAALAGQAGPALASADTFLALAEDYFDALIDLDHHAGAGIVTDRHHWLRTLVAANGGVFKTSGAGGGDVGLVFARAGAGARRVASALHEAGVETIPLGFGGPGAQLADSRGRGADDDGDRIDTEGAS